MTIHIGATFIYWLGAVLLMLTYAIVGVQIGRQRDSGSPWQKIGYGAVGVLVMLVGWFQLVQWITELI